MKTYEDAAQEEGWAIAYKDGEKTYFHAMYGEWEGNAEALCYFYDIQVIDEEQS